MCKTGKTPAHVSQKHELQSRRQHGAAGGERLIPPGFTSVDTPGVPLLPTQLFLSVVLSLSLRSLHPSLRPAAYRSRSACRPASSACRRTSRGPLLLRAPHIFSSSSGDQRGAEAGNTGPALAPLPGSTCFSAIVFSVL